MVVAIEEPPLAVAVEEPPLAVAVEEPPLAVAVEEPPLAVAVEEPPLAVAIEEPPLAIAVEKVRPDAAYTRRILAAVHDIRLCEEMFDSWMTPLNKCAATRFLRPPGPSNDIDGDYSVAISKKPDERERLLRFYLGQLRDNAQICSRAANEILRCHVQFANLMAQQMDYAANSRLNALSGGNSETTRLADDISQASRELLHYVIYMNDDLISFVSSLEEIRDSTLRKEQGLAGWIWEWLKYLFETLSRIFVTCGPFIDTVLHSIEKKPHWVEPAASALCIAAQACCAATSGAFSKYTFPCKEKMIDPRRRTP